MNANRSAFYVVIERDEDGFPVEFTPGTQLAVAVPIALA